MEGLNDETNSEEPKPKGEKFWLILVIVLFIITVCLAVILFFFDNIFSQNKVSYLMKANRECSVLQNQIEVQQVIAKTNEAIYAQVNLTTQEVNDLQEVSCVLAIYTTAEAEQELAAIRDELKNDLEEDIKTWKLKRTIVRKDLTDKESLKKYLHSLYEDIPLEITESPEIGIISPYQYFVTPEVESVQSFSNKFASNEDLYFTAALNWVWVSEQTLNNAEEKWLLPEEFLTATPNYSTNPLPGMIVSDCSEQANALASAYRASGVPASDVRVVLGLVNFESSIGGHAWVELKQGNNWLVLDPTSGPYYDDETNQLVETLPIPFEYFLYHQFPVVERWYFYNDQYFKDLSSSAGNAPSSWAAQGIYNQQVEFEKIIINPDKQQQIKNRFLRRIKLF